MNFKKYPSLTNDYRQREIGHWLEKYPELKNEVFSITEKIHGANFQILITKDGIKFGKRSSYLKDEDSFFGFQDVVKKYEDKIEILRQYLVNQNLESIKLYGELFGGAIQKGVDYGIEKNILIFDLVINDEIQTPCFMNTIFKLLKIEDWLVPNLGEVYGIFEALDFNSKFNSKLSEKSDNICEGIVIKPKFNIYKNNDSIFYIKKKNNEFKEKTKTEKSPKEFSSELLKLQTEFASYINKNRLDGLFSKEGEIQSEKEIGHYIKLLIEDAKIDFLKDHLDDVKNIDDKDLKFMYSKGNKLCVELIKKCL